MVQVFRRFLVVLITLAVIGLGFPPARAAETVHHPALTAMPCDMQKMASGGVDGHGHAPKPCAPQMDCADHGCCVAVVLLPDRHATEWAAIHAESVVYWPAGARLAGLASEPDPLPPRAT